MVRFEPGFRPLVEHNEPSWWLAFCDNRLLVEERGEVPSLPHLTDLARVGLDPLRPQYLGELNGSPCCAAELERDIEAPPGMRFRGLRGLFDAMGEDFFVLAGRAFQLLYWDRNHRYCGRCGTPTEDKPKERAKICSECGHVAYPTLCPAIIVAVTKGDRILLARSSHFRSGFHSVLAGFVEPGETFEECVKREVREEVGVEVKNVKYFGSQPWPFPNSLMVGFTAEHDRGRIEIDGVEIVDAAWFGVDALPPIPGKLSIARRLIDAFMEARTP